MAGNRSKLAQSLPEGLLLGLTFLFFMELLADFISAIYNLNLLTTSINENILGIVFLFAPAILLAFRKKVPRLWTIISGEGLVVCRIVSPLLDITGMMLVSGAGVAFFFLFFPSLLYHMGQIGDAEKESTNLGWGLAGGLLAVIAFRAFGSSLDVTMYGIYQWIGWVLAVCAGILVAISYSGESRPITAANKPLSKESPSESNAEDDMENDSESKIQTPGVIFRFRRLAAVVFGMMGVLACIYFTIASPAILARWVEGDNVAITCVLLASLAAFCVVMAVSPDWLQKIGPRGWWVWNLAFIAGVVAAVLANATLDQPFQPIGLVILQQFPLYAAIVFSPVLLADFLLLSRALLQMKPSFARLGASFLIAAIYLLIIIFAAVFTIVWDYIPGIGPFFQNMLWGVMLVICVAACLPVFLLKGHKTGFQKIIFTVRRRAMLLGLVGIIVASGITGVTITTAVPPAPPSSPSSLKIITYNIQQGADVFGNRAYDSQLAVLRNADADIIGLEESDLARPSGGNLDYVRFFADQLNYYSYYGPKTVTGTFGIALLSRYPIINATTFYMPGEGEQTACIQAQIVAGSRTFNVFVTHLGNAGALVQLYPILNRTVQLDNVILMGDFNFENGTAQWQAANATLHDAWYQRWPAGQDDHGYWGFTDSSIDPTQIIDHIFVSPSITVTDCRVLTSFTASDHFPVTATVLA
ncbi:MAG TPA: endonuclease/exonuclease/phosphatase family protein [Candidatus Lokiarchaeia archaeon]|nr:endonuclease/exonuclease/phosphatase family protein [Candidatus Lokiarchaeia archaeon]